MASEIEGMGMPLGGGGAGWYGHGRTSEIISFISSTGCSVRGEVRVRAGCLPPCSRRALTSNIGYIVVVIREDAAALRESFRAEFLL